MEKEHPEEGWGCRWRYLLQKRLVCAKQTCRPKLENSSLDNDQVAHLYSQLRISALQSTAAIFSRVVLLAVAAVAVRSPMFVTEMVKDNSIIIIVSGDLEGMMMTMTDLATREVVVVVVVLRGKTTPMT